MKYVDIIKRQRRSKLSMRQRLASFSKNLHIFQNSNLKTALSVIGVAVLVLQLISPLSALAAPPSDFPVGNFPSAGYMSLGPDADESGCKTHRNVLESYYQILNNQTGTDQFLFLRLRNEDPAGWPSSGSNGDARYKWFFDTVGNDGALVGGTIENFEYFLTVEDPPDNTNDGFGEIKFYNASESIIGGPVTGSGSSAPSGPQTAYHSDFGYKISGNYVDMYMRLSVIGSPSQFKLFWSTDQENQNLDQAPNCDRPDSGAFIAFYNLTVNGAGDGNGSVTGPGISCTITAGVASGDCGETYNSGASVSLSATEDSGSTFDGWSGNCSGTGTCNLTMNSNKSVTASFSLLPPPSGTIIIEKVTLPADSQNFDFTSDVSGHESFSLSNGGSEPMQNVLPGSYSVSETLNSNYNTTVSCTNGAQGTTSVDVDLNAGQTITCTFTNTLKQGGVTVVKVTNPQSSDQEFTFDPSWSQDNFTITGSGSQNFNLDAGDYSVAENSVDGWEQTSATCIDQDDNSVSPNGFTLAPDGSITCTFVNTQHGHLIVNKATDPQEDDTEFSITASGDGTISGSPDAVISSGNPADYEVTPGTYSVSEYPVTGWEETGNTCQGVPVGAGETVGCTITNTQQGKIIVEKQTDPSGSLESFEFEPSWDDNFTLSDDEQNDSGYLTPGTYSVSEINLPARWSLDSASCDDDSDPSEIVLDPGETVTCVFNNLYSPEADLEIGKTVGDGQESVTVETGDTVEFTVTVTNDGPDAATGVVVNDLLPAGLDFVSANPSGDYNSVTGVWTVGDLAVNESATLTIQAQVTQEQDGVITNTAGASFSIDPNSDNDSDSADVVVGNPVLFTLTVTTNGDGEGVVTGEGINCDSNPVGEENDCSEIYASGTVVTLTADPDEGSNFDSSWTVGAGTCTGSTTPCQVTMNQNQNLTAHFALNSVTPPGPTPPPPPPPTPPGPIGGGGPTQFITPTPPQVLGETTPPAPPLVPAPAPAPAPQVEGAQTLPRTGMELGNLIWLTLAIISPLGFRFKPKRARAKK